MKLFLVILGRGEGGLKIWTDVGAEEEGKNAVEQGEDREPSYTMSPPWSDVILIVGPGEILVSLQNSSKEFCLV